MTLAEIQAGLDARLSHARRRIPIIVVPGVMGTRLRTLDGDMVWNPQITLGSLPAMDVDRLAHIRLPLLPADEEVSDEEYQAALSDESRPTRTGARRSTSPESRATVCGRHVRHWGAPIHDFYGDLIQRLYFDLPAALPPDVMPKVYCCGYDWRQSNAVSANDLARVVAEARSECDGEQVILLAHSMGGLVSRYFCRVLGGEEQVRALFLLGSPTLGAPKPYLLLKRGIPDMEVRYAVVGWTLSEERSRAVCRSMPSGYELCPSPTYCAHVDPGFMVFEPAGTGYPAIGPLEPGRSFRDASDPARFYDDIYTGVRDLPEDRGDASYLMQRAITFHQRLMVGRRVYMHPRSYCLFAKDLETVVRLELPLEGRLHMPDGNYNVVQTSPAIAHSTLHGDTAVPVRSANPDPSLLTHAFRGIHELTGVEHVAMSNDIGAYRYIESTIATIAGEASAS